MLFIRFLIRTKQLICKKIARLIFQYPRILKYRLLSTCKQISGRPKLYQPVQINGKGNVIFKQNVVIGVDPSPFLHNGYSYIDSRNVGSTIEVGKNCRINNNFIAIAESEGIKIGDNVLIGLNCELIDSDFHDLDPFRRHLGGVAKKARIIIGENVFIGSNVKIMKGVEIGKNSVIANGSIVTKSIPDNVIAAGIPAKVIRTI
ncbi:TPA: acyltransferase [Kluyvera georgiana]